MIGSALSEAKAARRMSAPSSSRTFDRMWVARRSVTSSGRSMRSTSAFFLRMAARVSNSGGSIWTRMPHSKREQSRSSSPFSSLGLRSLERTIWTWWSCRSLKVWKNSSAVLSFPARNCTSSTMKASHSRYFRRNSSRVPFVSASTKSFV